MDWPPQSPDLNPIEQLWDHLDRRLRKTPPVSVTDAWEKLAQFWGEIDKSVLQIYVHSMKRRCEAVIIAKGGHTVTISSTSVLLFRVLYLFFQYNVWFCMPVKKISLTISG